MNNKKWIMCFVVILLVFVFIPQETETYSLEEDYKTMKRVENAMKIYKAGKKAFNKAKGWISKRKEKRKMKKKEKEKKREDSSEEEER